MCRGFFIALLRPLKQANLTGMKYVLIFAVGLFVGVGLFTLAFHFFNNTEAGTQVRDVVREYSPVEQAAPAPDIPDLPQDMDYNEAIDELTGQMNGATSSLNNAVKAAEKDLQGFAGQLHGVLEAFEKLIGKFEEDTAPARSSLDELSKNLERAMTPQQPTAPTQ